MSLFYGVFFPAYKAAALSFLFRVRVLHSGPSSCLPHSHTWHFGSCWSPNLCNQLRRLVRLWCSWWRYNRSRQQCIANDWWCCRPRSNIRQRCWKTLLLGLVPQMELPHYSPRDAYRMVEKDDPQVFLEVFVATEEACWWLGKEWTLRLLPLLSGKAQAVAVSLPATAMTNDVMACALPQRSLALLLAGGERTSKVTSWCRSQVVAAVAPL